MLSKHQQAIAKAQSDGFAGYVAQLLAPSVREYAALVPGRTLPCVWNFFTAGLLEVHILMASTKGIELAMLAPES